MKLTKIIMGLALTGFLFACGGASTENESSKEQTVTEEVTKEVTDSLATEIEKGAKEVEKTAEELENEVDELLKDI